MKNHVLAQMGQMKPYIAMWIFHGGYRFIRIHSWTFLSVFICEIWVICNVYPRHLRYLCRHMAPW
jgi:hypothetical protein